MTVRINFLPKGSTNAGGLGPKEWATVAAVSLAVVGGGIFYANTYAATNRLERQLVADQAALAAMQADLAQAAEITAREQAVELAEAELRALHGRDWSDVLSTLRGLTPQHVTWTKLDATGDRMTLKATSSGLFDVAQLFAGLVQHPLVDEVALTYVDEKGVPITAIVRQTPCDPNQPGASKQGITCTAEAAPPQQQASAAQTASASDAEATQAEEEGAQEAAPVQVVIVQPEDVQVVIGILRQMEFEMVIQLVPVKGGGVYGT